MSTTAIELIPGTKHIIEHNSGLIVKKVNIIEITKTTILFENLDNLSANKERLTISEFNRTWKSIEHIN